MKCKYVCFFFAGLLIFACNNSSNNDNGNNGGLESSSSSYDEDSSSSSSSEPNSDISSSSVGDSSSSSRSSSSSLEAGSSSSSSTISSSSKVSSSSSVKSSSSSSEDTPEVTNWPTLKEGDAGVQKGWGTRYWDGCKPHCSLRNNVDTTAVPFTVCRNCDINNKEIPAFTLSPNVNPYWLGYEETKSSCLQGGIAYVCWDMAPRALNENLAYAFVAASQKDACGKCFQIQFDGGNHDNLIKEAHRLIKGKTLIAMATNTGTDVAGDQFDIMVPGGGPGMFNSFATQMGVDQSLLGANNGGLLTTCQLEINNYDTAAVVFQDCVKKKCNAVFNKPEHKQLLDGCLWFVDWYMTADNPTFIYKEVECPKYFTDKYPSTINKDKNNKIEPKGGFKNTMPADFEYDKWIWE